MNQRIPFVWRCGTLACLGDIVEWGETKPYVGEVSWSDYFESYQVSVGTGLTLSKGTVNEFRFIRRANETFPYYFAWKNNSKRETLYKRACRVIARGDMNSCQIEFEDGQCEIVSRNALRKRGADRVPANKALLRTQARSPQLSLF